MADTPNMQDVKAKVSDLDLAGKLVLFGGLAGLIGTFLSWYTVEVDGTENPMLAAMSAGINHKIQGIDAGSGRLAALGLVAAVGTLGHSMFASVPDTQKALYKKIQLGGCALAVLAAVWFWLDADSTSGDGVSAGHGMGFWVSLFGAAAAGYGAFQRFKAPAA